MSDPQAPNLGSHQPVSNSGRGSDRQGLRVKNPLGHQEVATERCYRDPHGTNLPAEIPMQPLFSSYLRYLCTIHYRQKSMKKPMHHIHHTDHRGHQPSPPPWFVLPNLFLSTIAPGLVLTCWIPVVISFASPAMLLAALDSEAALPRMVSARSVFSLALATMLLITGSLLIASSASLLLSSACRLNSKGNAYQHEVALPV